MLDCVDCVDEDWVLETELLWLAENWDDETLAVDDALWVNDD